MYVFADRTAATWFHDTGGAEGSDPGTGAAHRELWAELGGAGDPWSARITSDPGFLPAGSAGFWQGLYLVDHSTRSQYDVLRELGHPASEPEGHLACHACEGGSFHGQYDRPWIGLKGNLHLSLRLQVDLPAAQYGLAMTMLPAVAVCQVVERLSAGSVPVGIKWVNDVTVGGRKLAGVLTSVRSVAGRLESVVLGIGLNVAAAPELPASPFVTGTTCLTEEMSDGAPALPVVLGETLACVASLLKNLEAHGPAWLLDHYRRRSLVVGRRVAIWPARSGDGTTGTGLPAPSRQGIVAALDADLCLRLVGQSEPVASGRLSLLPD